MRLVKSNYKAGYGDMYTKVAWAVACAPYTKYCGIINGHVPNNLTRALLGEIQGTRVI